MKTAIGMVRGGQVRLPADAQPPEGQQVLVQWSVDPEEPGTDWGPYLEREPLTLEDARADLQWATGRRFPSTTKP
jgi:hypothetical protein